MKFTSLEQMVVGSFEAMRPSARMSVTEAAERYHIIRQPGSHNGPWSRDLTPYLVEPQDVLTSLEHQAMIFVGPARTGKSMMLTNWVIHTAKTDPADTMVVHMAQHTAREWVKSDFEKSVRNSPEFALLMSPSRDDDNLFDKAFLSGMRMTITWPTAKNLSGKTIPRHWIMDYDRIADNVDGEGSAFDMTTKRGDTFKRFKMTAAESSPGRDLNNPRFIPRTPHEAPPVTGILSLYNLGDRRRYYWPCPQCETAFEPDFKTLEWAESDDVMEAAESVYMVCPHCGGTIEPGQKIGLNRAGRWVRDGTIWLPATDRIETIEGLQPTRSNIASFWLKGPAASHVDWKSIVLRWLQAEKVYAETGDETKLRVTVNTDQGLPYTPRVLMSARLPEALREKAEDWGGSKAEPVVPLGVRFLIATVDVQSNAFVVQVHGFTGAGDVFIVDGFKIRKSASRKDANGESAILDPSAAPEDWGTLVEQVIGKTYPVADASGRRMSILLTGCDSGGREGVTHNAYAFWRRLKADGNGLHRVFQLVKGNARPPAKTNKAGELTTVGAVSQAPTAYVAWPDSNQTGRKAVARGDVPVVMLNSDLLKDRVAGMLARRTGDDLGGGGMVRFPQWSEDWLYSQLTNEVRTQKGTWTNTAKRRNEAWDLIYYAVGLALRPFEVTAPLATVGLSKLDWDSPPLWAAEWNVNDHIIWPEAVAPPRPAEKRPSLAELGSRLA